MSDPTQRGFRVAFSPEELSHLRTLARSVPTLDAAVAQLAALRARLALPSGTVHVLSDVHGEHVKLRHVVNNASGRLRPRVEQRFADRLPEAELHQLLNLLYYPAETLADLQEAHLEPAARRAFLRRVVPLQLELLREVAAHLPLAEAAETFHAPWRDLLTELLVAPALQRDDAWFEAIWDALDQQGRALHLVRYLSRAIRNLTTDELIVAGDLGDRGPRIDKVIGFLMRLPHVSVIWGNHDVAWMGACLGQPALIATVLRISLRYGRLAQLTEGYGIPFEPLRRLALLHYGDDPCARFAPKTADLHDPLLIARMQKAAAVLQFKLEGQLIARHPEWDLQARDLLPHLTPDGAHLRLDDGTLVPLADTHLPTVDPYHPNALHPDEQTCIDALRAAFLQSPTLWEHMSWLFRQGVMYAVRDHHLIFHAALPIDADDQPLPLTLDGQPHAGKPLFDACQAILQRAFRDPNPFDLDLLWYLWAGPASPLFGKDRMATFESYFIADKAYHREVQNPWFHRIHDADFVKGVLRDFGVDPERGVIVNGHVPVRIERGESPLKRGGNALTIDGAFAAAYGDKGYSLLLEPHGATLALHHPFESVEESIHAGADIIPQTQTLRRTTPPHTLADTEAGPDLQRQLQALQRLIVAYQENLLREAL